MIRRVAIGKVYAENACWGIPGNGPGVLDKKRACTKDLPAFPDNNDIAKNYKERSQKKNSAIQFQVRLLELFGNFRLKTTSA
ncbi:MAG: hypothetical protein LBK63_08240 [Treponema sp.]|nr:hypothetical protein [Treponema sp.]